MEDFDSFQLFPQICPVVVIPVHRFAESFARTSWKLVKRCRKSLIHYQKVDVDHRYRTSHYGNAFYRVTIIRRIHLHPKEVQYRKSIKSASIRRNCIAVTRLCHQSVVVFVHKHFQTIGQRHAATLKTIAIRN